jgi:SHS2 domain-containing protein
MTRYEVLAHTADTGIIAYGSTPEEMFENAAFGMFDLVFPLSAVPVTEERQVEVEAPDLGELLVAWLSELLAVAEIDDLVFSSFRVAEIGAGKLVGTALGSTAQGVELVGPPVKAVTFHDLEVTETEEEWRARVIFDV